jgi:hypothetical protein
MLITSVFYILSTLVNSIVCNPALIKTVSSTLKRSFRIGRLTGLYLLVSIATSKEDFI